MLVGRLHSDVSIHSTHREIRSCRRKKQGTQVTPDPSGTRDVTNALTMKFALIP